MSRRGEGITPVHQGIGPGGGCHRLIALAGSRRTLLAVALTLLLMLPFAPSVSAAPPAKVFFPGTGHTLSDRFLTMWRTHGGLAIFGYPISESLNENGMTVQYFERARFELHPEFLGTPYEVQLTALGRDLIQGRNDPALNPFPANTAAKNAADRVFFPQTGHYLAYGFKQYWETHGGLQVFGYPISEEMTENGRTVQYFERARFEWWPENKGTPYEVQLGRLGADSAAKAGVSTASIARPAGVPNFSSVSFTQSVHLPVLMYHNIGGPASRYVMPLGKLNQQLDWLQANGYHTITLDQAYAYIDGTGSLPSKPIVLSFDDAYASQWDAAAALDAHGMHGVFFIISGHSGLSPSQLRSMADRGHEIESHTISHPYLTQITDAQLAHELTASKATLEQITGRPVDYIAYPYGAEDSRVVNAVIAAGYRGALNAWGGKEWTPNKLWVEPRYEVSGLDTLSDFIVAAQ